MEFYIPSKSNLTVKYEQRSLAGYNPWGRKELDMTERLSLTHFKFNAQSPLCVELTKDIN